MMKRANKNVTLTMEYLEEPIFFFIQCVIQPQVFIYIYPNGGRRLTKSQLNNNKFLIMMLKCIFILIVN